MALLPGMVVSGVCTMAVCGDLLDMFGVSTARSQITAVFRTGMLYGATTCFLLSTSPNPKMPCFELPRWRSAPHDARIATGEREQKRDD